MRRNRFVWLFGLGVAGSALLQQWALAASEPRKPEPTLAAPITAVTVYSDRARVVRTAHVSLAGAGSQRITLPVLSGHVDPSSIRIDVRGGQIDVERVEIAWVDSSELPVSEAQQLLTSLEQLDDQQSRLSSERGIYQSQLDLLSQLTPTAPPLPQNANAKPVPLNPTGWGAVFGFVRGQQEKLQARISESAEKSRGLSRKREQLVEQVRLLGGLQKSAGYRVIPTLRGSGEGELAVSYLTRSAWWMPSYDIQLVPGRGQVELAYYGQVSQDTGEDWTDVALTLSTAVPGTATELPRLASWKIGSRERFIPTPPPAYENPPPPPPNLKRQPPERSQADLLRHQLSARAQVSPESVNGTEDKAGKDSPDTGKALDEDSKVVKEEAKKTVPVKGRSFEQTAEIVAAAPAAPRMLSAADSFPTSSGGELIAAQQTSMGNTKSVNVVGVGIAPPPGYRAPRYRADSAAARAGGYDLSYPSLYKESLGSGKGSRRVALFSRSFPVQVQRKVFAALAPEAYLVAEINNPSQQPLPGGRAQLFVGADPAGVATIDMVAPGEAFTLPLGIDRAVKPVRNVHMSTVERGVFSKDEVTEYMVTTELVNPYRQAIEVRLLDQVPMQGNKDVELKLVRTEPPATPDPTTGGLQWRLTVPAGAKIETRFIYTLRRPKGARVYQ